ncbi:MAG: hypothetical protein HDR92_07095 [Bacteroides sp.]|nr:hypothetical protein [Bacteroides sp.]
MKLITRLFIAVMAIMAPVMVYASDDVDIPVDKDFDDKTHPEKNNDNDYIEPPYCCFSREKQEVYVNFDYYCGNATITVTAADGQTWSAVSSTMIQPMSCSFAGAQGLCILTITTTTGLSFRGQFIAD